MKPNLNKPPSHISPHCQGHLDSLCGIYGIINAIRWGIKDDHILSKHQSRLLYLRLIQHLEDRELLASAMELGLNIPEVSQLLYLAKEWLADRKILLNHRKPFHKQKAVETTKFLKCITTALNTSNTAVLMATTGRLDHWTAVISANKKRLLVLDSSMRSHINTNTGDAMPLLKSGKTIQFMPTGLFILSFKYMAAKPNENT